MTKKNDWLTPAGLKKLKTNPPECADKLRKLVKDATQHSGEFVLVIERYREISGCLGILAPRHIPDHFFVAKENFLLGVLKKNGRARVHKNLFSMIFPTGYYAQGFGDRLCSEAWACEGNLVAGTRVLSLLQLDRPTKGNERFSYDSLAPKLALEIMLGDRAVEEWFALSKVAKDPFVERARQQRKILFENLARAFGQLKSSKK
jgi:hypothetical protein